MEIKKLYRILILSILLIIVGILCYLETFRGHTWGDDFALYIDQGRSIIDGGVVQLKEDTSFALQHSTHNHFSPALYPWGEPFLLSWFYYFFGLNLEVFILVSAFFLPLTAITAYFIFRKKLDFLSTVIVVALWSFSPFIIRFSPNIETSLNFTAFLLIALTFSEKVLLDINYYHVYRYYIFTGIAILIAFSFRTEGILVLFSYSILHAVLLFRRSVKFNQINFYIPYVVVLFVCITSHFFLTDGTSTHFSHFNYTDIHSIANNIINYTRSFHGYLSSYVPLWLYYLSIPIVFMAMYIRRRQDAIYIIFMFCDLSLFILWPDYDQRFCLSLFLFYCYFIVVGLRYMFKILLASRPYISYVFLCSILILSMTNSLERGMFMFKSLRRSSDIIADGPESQQAIQMFNFVGKFTKRGDVIAFFRPRAMRLFTHRKSLAISTSFEELKQQADYYVYHKNMGNFFQVNMNNVHLETEKVFENENFEIFRLRKSGK